MVSHEWPVCFLRWDVFFLLNHETTEIHFYPRCFFLYHNPCRRIYLDWVGGLKLWRFVTSQWLDRQVEWLAIPRDQGGEEAIIDLMDQHWTETTAAWYPCSSPAHRTWSGRPHGIAGHYTLQSSHRNVKVQSSDSVHCSFKFFYYDASWVHKHIFLGNLCTCSQTLLPQSYETFFSSPLRIT